MHCGRHPTPCAPCSLKAVSESRLFSLLRSGLTPVRVFSYTAVRNTRRNSGKKRYLRLIRQMKDAGRAVPIRDDVVDSMEATVTDGDRGNEVRRSAHHCSSWSLHGVHSHVRLTYGHLTTLRTGPCSQVECPQVRIYTSARNADPP